MSNYLPQVEQLQKVAVDVDNEKAVNVAKFLKQRIENPDSYVVCLGESCSGKSTIINKIIGKDILPVSGIPSTAAITEICLDKNCKENEYYAINNNATMEVIDEETFKKLALNPDSELKRLRFVSDSDADWSGIKLFDTPGYGSLVEEHEEVLMSFLPECDAILYTVSYKIGIQDEDYVFLNSMSELTRCGIPFCLIINRCPVGIKEEDVRVSEIYKYVIGLLEVNSVPIILVESFNTQETNVSISSIKSIQDFILKSVKSEERLSELDEAFRGYTNDLCDLIETGIDKKISFANLDAEEAKILVDATKEYIKTLRNAEKDVIEPEFESLMQNFPKHVDFCAENLKNDCIREIDKQSVFDKEEVGAFVSNFLFQHYGKKQASELQFYLETELNAIDEKLDDYLNKAIVKIENDLQIKNVSQAAKTGFEILKGGGKEALGKGLLIYFARFGGQGGAGAGMANAASHFLKEFGKLFGKTFSRETHNALKHFLKQIGLTSTKSLAAAAVIVVDAVAAIIDLTTWKATLRKSIGKAIEKWSDDVKELTGKDLAKLKEDNIKNLEELACMAEEELLPLTKEEKVNIDYLNLQKNLVQGIRRSLEA